MLKGPTGCGKSRFVEYMAWKLGKPLITVACNEDMTASDLVGRYLLDASGTRWLDGPLTTAARIGCDLLSRRDRRSAAGHHRGDPSADRPSAHLPLDKKGELVEAHADFQLVISYNPGYQSLMKDLKQSTKQRFTAFDFDYPEAALETQIVAQESGIDAATAATPGEDRADGAQPQGPRPRRGHLDAPRRLCRDPDQTRRRSLRMPAAWPWCDRSPTTPTSAPRSIMPSMPASPEKSAPATRR
jgi:hypothetical protein